MLVWFCFSEPKLKDTLSQNPTAPNTPSKKSLNAEECVSVNQDMFPIGPDLEEPLIQSDLRCHPAHCHVQAQSQEQAI